MDIAAYWEAVLRQDGEKMRGFFRPDAVINWQITNEQFTVEEFIRVNCEYPGEWDGEIQRTVEIGGRIVTTTHVFSRDRSPSFHVTSFMEMREGKIAVLDEFWEDDAEDADDRMPPQWRREMGVGRPIR